ncbi:5-methyltetrahydropteroyltriglutamate--homocysteine S-methyltransferase [Helicobacter canis]|uniref:5-methyltetrahydropteroyltriglutamate-- homocysteine S-methyltransferase n=1 Tax=Helicobacter canis TaxID=29419 RepID=UPI0026EAD630|nr:5-methyltetrahydropteroyltriglutamate--homocysteine S-methyltransferase [Helicobacter canis]
MSQIIGFPRIGENRELKRALESFWGGKISQNELEKVAKELRAKHWAEQKGLDYVCVNDFSFYDNVLDLAYTLGAKPARFQHLSGLGGYFAMARGHKDGLACAMTKWFNTNYHFVVPELSSNDIYKVDASAIVNQYKEAKALGYKPKISLIGIFTFVALSKITQGEFAEVFNSIKAAYFTLLDELARLDSSVLIEFSEPIFTRGVDERFYDLIKPTYDAIANKGIKAVVSTFFEHSNEASEILLESKIYGLGLDFIYGEKNTQILAKLAASDKVLYAGVIDGRNIWIADLESKLALLEQIATHIPKERIVISSSCSLLHAPYSKAAESKMDSEILSWLSFGLDKIDELLTLDVLFRAPNDSARSKLESNQALIATRRSSSKIHNGAIKARLESTLKTMRDESFAARIKAQRAALAYPDLATTTIGSFPQTQEIRALRLGYKKGAISKEQYDEGIKAYIKDCIAFQEEIGLDVLVHGEPERNDMVEYFGEQMKGFVFSQNAWVQSYGSRCVKPPIIYGDVSRPKAMTTEWITYAQSLTKKLVKGMLTGPVTILNWSFVRDDVPRSVVCKQIALGIADEIDDLQKAGIKIIQVDEAAFKEGYPLRAENIAEYERWALECFKIATANAESSTQIHTHMCYSEFNDIIKTIQALDADVISIETARSGNRLLQVFKEVGYKHEIGPGVYDIHSPRVPSVEELEAQIRALLEVLPKEQLWINPDCGLKTRKWEEVKPSLANLVKATKNVLHTLQ